MAKEQIESQRFSLIDNKTRDNCVKAMWLAHEQSEKPINVIITSEQEKRSQAQNRLYWKWVTYWGNKIGETKDSVHLYFKFRFLAPIYVRDDVGYRDMAKSIKRLKGTKEYPAIKQQVIKLTSTTTASTKQMNEYLNEIYQFCYGQGFLLPIPQDLSWISPTKRQQNGKRVIL